MKNKKKKKNLRLRVAVIGQEDFLVRRLGEEWDANQRRARGEALLRHAQASAAVVGKTLLALLLLAGTVSIIAVAPNIFVGVGRMARRRVFFEKEGMQKAQGYLRRKKLVMFSKDKGNRSLVLTEKGRARALSSTFNDLKIREQPRWDGIWRVVLFDIPDTQKWSRETLRKGLRDAGFVQLQKSVFVSPYPCEEELALLTAVCNAAGYVRLIRTREIIHDHDIRKVFSLA